MRCDAAVTDRDTVATRCNSALTQCYRNHLAYIICTKAHAVVGVVVGGLFLQGGAGQLEELMGQVSRGQQHY